LSKENTELGIALIGCGLIGKKRLENLAGARAVVVCDLQMDRAEALAKQHSCEATTDLERALGHSQVEAVIVATQNASLAPLSSLALKAQKHVLVEKPGAVTSKEVQELQSLALQQKRCVRVGFNHRYHPAFLKAQEIIREGSVGPLMFVRARYGHGGRVGYEREWRADPKLSGGGELMDQGVHLIDLAGLFLGPFIKIEGTARTYFWNMPVDDNAFLSLETASGQLAWLHVSCTEWKNLFSFELYFKEAKLHVEGLGGSYGTERLTHYRMTPEMGPPETTIYEFPQTDRSWSREMQDFIDDIQANRTPVPGLKEARAALDVVECIYQKSQISERRHLPCNA
jgi:predicted dehydrogenase